MHAYPHVYKVTARGGESGNIEVASSGLPSIQTAPPPQFGGPEGMWSPESLLCAAIADCFILTFRAVARAARLEWSTLECSVEGTLERVGGVSRFTRYGIVAHLAVPPDANVANAKALLEKTEHSCLISNSLSGSTSLEATVSTTATPPVEDAICSGCALPSAK